MKACMKARMKAHLPFALTAPGVLVLAVMIHCSIALGADAADPLRQAETALRSGDVGSAMALLRKAADQGHSGAQARLADLLHAAEFDKEALLLYRKSAEQGDPAGEFGLGRMHADGAGVPKDAAQALAWYRKAEQKNHAPALDALARAYRSGDLGLPRSPGEAAALEARATAAQQTTEPATPRETK
jgi:TPR repeat protein